jgi:hypothetical protein
MGLGLVRRLGKAPPRPRPICILRLPFAAINLRLAGSRRTIAQDGNVFQRAAEARLRLGVIEVDEPLADPLLARIVSGPNESANEARPRLGKVP